MHFETDGETLSTIGAATAIVGTFLPWITIRGSVTMTRSGLGGEDSFGVIVILLALITIFLIYIFGSSTFVKIYAVASAGIVIIMMLGWVSTLSSMSESANASVSPEGGFYVTLLGEFLLGGGLFYRSDNGA